MNDWMGETNRGALLLVVGVSSTLLAAGCGPSPMPLMPMPDAGACGMPCPCDPIRAACVACLSDDDCTFLVPHCDSSGEPRCVECASDEHCSGRTDAPLCETTAGVCVGCLSDTDCPGTVSVCDAGTCRGCADSSECATRSPDRPVCDAGACVECTRETQATDCGEFLCDEGVCTTERVGDLGPCRPCTATSDCRPGLDLVCVDYFLSGPRITTGFFCMYRGGSRAECDTPERAPYGFITSDTHVTAEDTLTQVCGPPVGTTCPGFNDALAESPCSEDDDCGMEGITDGLCAPPGTSRPGTCGYEAVITGDCPPGVESEVAGSRRICLP